MYRWFSGPSFLWSKDRDWPNSGKINAVSKEDPELKNEVSFNFTVTDDTIISRISLLTTRWFEMKKIMACVKRAKGFWTK